MQALALDENIREDIWCKGCCADMRAGERQVLFLVESEIGSLTRQRQPS